MSSNVTCLGVTLHEHMKWDAHLNALTPKCYTVISSLRRLREVGIPEDGLLAAYRALFEPVLGYCISIWGGGYATVMDRAQVMQNDALRAITGRRRRDSVRDLFATYHLLNVENLCRYRQTVMAFKMLRGTIPADIAFPLQTVHSRATRRGNDLGVPNFRRESSRQALAYRLPLNWNLLPSEIRALNSAASFTSKLKGYLVDS